MTHVSGYQQSDGIDTGKERIFSEDTAAMAKNIAAIAALAAGFSLFSLISFRSANLIWRAVFVFVIVGMLFALAISIYRIAIKRHTICVSPEGFQDSNIGTQTIPWSVVKAVEPISASGKRPLAVLVRLKPGVVGTLELNWRARHFLVVNDALWIAFAYRMIASELYLDLDRFSEMLRAYARTHGSGID